MDNGGEMRYGLLSVMVLGVLTGCVANTSGLNINRTLPEKIADVTTERQLLTLLDGVQGLTSNNHRVAINTFRGELLLTGEVPSDTVRRAISDKAARLPGVTKVYNYLKVMQNKSQSHTLHENYLKAKLNAKLLASGIISPTQYELVVRDDTAYLMGALTYPQLTTLHDVAASTDGVLALVSLVDVLMTESERSVLAAMAPAAASSVPATDNYGYNNYGYNTPNYNNDGTTGATTPPYYSAPSPVNPNSQARSEYVRHYEGTNHP